MKYRDPALTPWRWFCTLLFALPAVAWAEADWAALPHRPNIVLIFVDDLGGKRWQPPNMEILGDFGGFFLWSTTLS